MIWRLQYFCFMFVMLLKVEVSDTFSQYVSLSRKQKDLSSCDHKNHIALVEHFFNVIFAEFHNTPPVCVCVQMCQQQPTYCYPSGCMKTGDNRKKYESSQLVIPLPRLEANDTAKPLLVNENGEERTKSYITDFIEGNVGMKKALSEPSDNIIKSDVPKMNPLKDRYKMVFKYKRLPKVEMRYNLREQVKNMKADKLKIENTDMSNQRWPKGKHWIHSRQLIEPIPQLKIDEAKAKKFYMFTENNPSTDTSPKYFKRETSKVASEDEINVETLYIYQTDSSMESSNLSVETMIDNLIESSFEGLTNLVGMEANNTLNQSVDVKSSGDSSVYRAKMAIVKNVTDTATVPDNDTVKDSTPTYVEETTTQMDNVEDPNIILQSKTNFLDVIAKMSNKIEQQNNASIEIINRITGHNNLKHFETKPVHVGGDNKNNHTNSNQEENKESNRIIKRKRDITIINISLHPIIHDDNKENSKV